MNFHPRIISPTRANGNKIAAGKRTARKMTAKTGGTTPCPVAITKRRAVETRRTENGSAWRQVQGVAASADTRTKWCAAQKPRAAKPRTRLVPAGRRSVSAGTVLCGFLGFKFRFGLIKCRFGCRHLLQQDTDDASLALVDYAPEGLAELLFRVGGHAHELVVDAVGNQ